MSKDMVKRPDHYCFSKFEPKDVIREWGLNFNLGSAVKYIARAGRKDDIVQDLKKVREFLSFEIEALEAERKADTPDHPNCRCSMKDEKQMDVYNIALPHGNQGISIRVAIPADVPEDVALKIIEKQLKEFYGGKDE